MDVVVLTLAKKFATRVAAGFSSVTVDEETSTIKFILNDGTPLSLKIPTPKDGVSVTEAYLQNGHLIFEFSDSTVVDVGELPTPKIPISKKTNNAISQQLDGLYVEGLQISKKEGNIISKEDDGLYVASTGIEISKKDDNIISNIEDGLYASMNENADDIMKIVSDNKETEPLDFNNFFN